MQHINLRIYFTFAMLVYNNSLSQVTAKTTFDDEFDFPPSQQVIELQWPNCSGKVSYRRTGLTNDTKLHFIRLSLREIPTLIWYLETTRTRIQLAGSLQKIRYLRFQIISNFLSEFFILNVIGRMREESSVSSRGKCIGKLKRRLPESSESRQFATITTQLLVV